jgi:threonine/homoserine/homoserine lactone efflux protein
MDIDALLALILAGLVLAGSPGPNTMSLAAAGAAFGARRSIAYMIGLAFGMLAVMIIVASGVVAMLLAVPGIAPVATIAALLYFVYLAWKIATAPPLSEGGPERPAPALTDGLLLSLVNPKGYAAMLALFASHTLIADSLLGDAVLKIAATIAIIVFVNVIWLYVGAGLARFFQSPRASRIINVTFAILLLASAALLIPH